MNPDSTTTNEYFNNVSAKKLKKDDRIQVGKYQMKVVSRSKNSYDQTVINFRPIYGAPGSDCTLIVPKDFKFRVTRTHRVDHHKK